MIEDRTIEKVKEAANVVDVIGEFYPLKSTGEGMKTCLCPFHADRHLGSFKISERRNIYTCFSCGAHGSAVDFLMNHEKLSFVDAIRWLGKKYGIDVEGADQFDCKPAKPHTPPPPLPMLVLPVEMVRARADTTDDTLCNWLRRLPWKNAQKDRVEKMLKNYAVGHAKSGAVIWWQIDEKAQVRTGKLMMYKPDGHRDKTKNPTWIHAELARAGMVDLEKVERVTCYFGQHLIDAVPDATINIVESEKTALICAIAYGDMKKQLWVATGGMQNLNRSKLAPFIERNRKIVLYPDHDGVEKWKERAKEINYKNLAVNDKLVSSFWKEEDGEKADIADVIVRMMYDNLTALEKMKADNPALVTLINELDLKQEE